VLHIDAPVVGMETFAFAGVSTEAFDSTDTSREAQWQDGFRLEAIHRVTLPPPAP